MALLAGVVLILVLGVMGAVFWIDPERGLRETTHRIEALPRVMGGRYIAFALLAVVFTWDLWATGTRFPLAALFGVCVFMGAVDGIIYARRGRPHWKHSGSAVVSALGLALVIWA